MQDASSVCDFGSRICDSQVASLEEKAAFHVANSIVNGSSSGERRWLHFRRLIGLPVPNSSEPIRNDLLRLRTTLWAAHSAIHVEDGDVGESCSSKGLDGGERERGEVVLIRVGSSFSVGGEGSGRGRCVGEEVVEEFVSEEDFVVVVEDWLREGSRGQHVREREKGRKGRQGNSLETLLRSGPTRLLHLGHFFTSIIVSTAPNSP